MDETRSSGQVSECSIGNRFLFFLLLPSSSFFLIFCRFSSPQTDHSIASQFTSLFNHTSSLVVTTILLEAQSPVDRAAVVSFWVEVCRALRELQNYSSILAIVSAFTVQPIHRLKQTWNVVPAEDVMFIYEITQLMAKNFAGLRREFASLQPPAIPYIGAYQKGIMSTFSFQS